LARTQRSEVGDFRDGLARTVVRILRPLSVVSVVVLPALGVIKILVGRRTFDARP
jgi:K+-transporting ATPase A subunit